MKRVLICGAGNIGRGFLAQLLHRSGYCLNFLDADARLVELLNERGKYQVEIAARPELTEVLPVERAYHLKEESEIAELIAGVDLLVSSVGATHIEALAMFLREALSWREGLLNWLICENAAEPASTIRDALGEAFDAKRLGLVETQILRTAIASDAKTLEKDPLAVTMTDWWTLPADCDAWLGDPPDIDGLELKHEFANELRRKLYTFNGLNGPIAYVGYARGHRILHEAARAPELQSFLDEIQAESAEGLIGAYGFDPEEHAAFQKTAREKYADSGIEDSLERHARDSARKLGLRERLVGPAQLCLEQGRTPEAYVRAIAAAIDYAGSDDAGTLRVQEILKQQGPRGVIREICGLDEHSDLGNLIEEAWQDRTYLLD